MVLIKCQFNHGLMGYLRRLKLCPPNPPLICLHSDRRHACFCHGGRDLCAPHNLNHCPDCYVCPPVAAAFGEFSCKRIPDGHIHCCAATSSSLAAAGGIPVLIGNRLTELGDIQKFEYALAARAFVRRR